MFLLAAALLHHAVSTFASVKGGWVASEKVFLQEKPQGTLYVSSVQNPYDIPLNPGWLIGVLIMAHYNPYMTG